jgi:hypothetical protein
VVLIVAGFIAWLNVAVITAVLGQTRVELFGGVTEVTVGIVPVVNVQMKLIAGALPAGSFTPVVMVPLYLVLGSRLAAGVNVAVVPE